MCWACGPLVFDFHRDGCVQGLYFRRIVLFGKEPEFFLVNHYVMTRDEEGRLRPKGEETAAA